MKLVTVTLLLVSLILLSSSSLSMAGFSSPAPAPAPTPASPLSFCDSKCAVRCQKAGRAGRCLKYCRICCRKCHCVPSGTYGNKSECPCYRDMKSPKGKPKCP